MDYLHLPSKPGVYLFLDENRKVIYVGKAIDLKSRVSSYFLNNQNLGEKTAALVAKIIKIQIIIVESELEALLLEAHLIKKYRPHYNIRMADDKSYPYIRITKKEIYPGVVIARHPEDARSVYFGPYPSSGSVKLVLKLIRKIFPYQSTLNHPKRICLYNHLGLCPCATYFASPEARVRYKKNISGIIKILEGKSRSVMKDLEKVRESLSKGEKFEEASEVQKHINALIHILEPFHRPLEYDLNPNLRVDIRQRELFELQQTLAKAGLLTDYLRRIECYDISNIQGTHATGSLVVLTDGEIDKSQYRKFKIRKDPRPDDFAMMAEMLTRRLGHIADWGLPNLIVVDGGKGQVSATLRVLQEHKLNIPLIGLAKREETIVIPQMAKSNKQAANFIEVSLPKDRKALHLIMRIRDEAHRFAIVYHRKLRSKKMII